MTNSQQCSVWGAKPSKSTHSIQERTSNILFVVPQLRRGGGEKQFLLLLQNIDRALFVPVVACLEDINEYADEFSKLAIPVCHIYGNKPLQMWRLLQLMRLRKIDIVHTWLNNEWGRIAAIAYRALFAQNVLVISSERNEMQHSTRRFKHVFIMLARVLSFATDVITFNSPKAIAYWEKGFFRRGISKFIGNGIDKSEIRFNVLPLTAQPLRVAIVARLVIQKNHKLILRALASYSKKSLISLTFVGDGPLRGEIERLIESLGLVHHVSLVGKRANIPEIISQNHVGMLCSQSEGFSNAVLEYLANGLAIIVTDAGANTFCLDGNGFLVENEADIHASWDFYIDSPAQLEEHRKRSLKVAESFIIPAIARQYESLYVR